MGGASSIVALIDNGIGIGAGEQQELVPLQRQVIELELAEQNKQAQPNSGGNSGSRTMNARASNSGNTKTETVKYINESEKED